MGLRSTGARAARQVRARLARHPLFGNWQRLIACIAVLAVHAALLMVVRSLRPRVGPAGQSEVTALLLMLPAAKVDPSATDKTDHRSAVPQRARRADTPAPLQEPAPAADLESGHAPQAIDWAREARQAAEDEINAEERAARAAPGLSGHRKTPRSLAPAAPPQPQFAWSHASTHRLESVPGGGIILNLTDRCAIVFSYMLIPVCRLGPMEPRGDLLQHMHDPPQLGAAPGEVP
jgi:hypothetical protein